MRTEIAPNRLHRPASPPVPDISLCLVTHRSHMRYYEGREEITRLTIKSLLAGVKGISYELIIWDNGSLPEYHEYLRTFHPTVLVESENTGGYNGRRAMLGIARGKYACITDDDVLFSPAWLREQMRIVKMFPGHLATGIPRNYKSAALPDMHGETNVCLYQGKILPQAWYDDLMKAGYFLKGMKRYEDYIIEREGVYGWLVKMDTQVFGETEILRRVHDKYDEKTIASSGGICEKMEELGILEIATLARTCAHIGNTIDESIVRLQKEFADPSWDVDVGRMTKVYDDCRKIL